MAKAKATAKKIPRNVKWELARVAQVKPVKSKSIVYSKQPDGLATISFDITTDLLIDSGPTVIQDIEPIMFKYPSEALIGKLAPTVLSGRKDFPKDLPHLNPTNKDEPACLCLARAGLQAVYDVGGVVSTIHRLIDWLNDAKTTSLYQDGWDPVPPMGLVNSVLGRIDNEALQAFATAKPEGGYAYICAEIKHLGNDRVFVDASKPILDTFNAEEREIAASRMKASYKDYQFFDTAIPAIFCWPPHDRIEEKTHFAIWREMESLTQGLRETGLHDSLDVAFIKLDSLFGENQDSDKHGKKAILVVFGLWRPAPLDPTIVGLSTNEKARSLELRAFYLQRERRVVDRWSTTSMLRDLYGLVPTSSRILEAVSGEAALDDIALFGSGALGSAFIDYAVRGGATKLSIIDDDRLLPHNIARHRASRWHVPHWKADVADQLADERVEGTVVAKDTSDVALMESDELGHSVAGHSLVIDATTDPLVRRRLSGAALPEVPLVRTEIFNRGRLGVFMATRFGNPVNLNCLFYQLIASAFSNHAVRQWLRYEESRSYLDDELILGFGCRSTTTRMPAYRIDAHASALFALCKKQMRNPDKPTLAISEIDEDGLHVGTRFLNVDDVTMFGPNRETSDWKIIVTNSVLASLHRMRETAAPVETGGYLFGAIDEDLSEIYVVAVSDEPPFTTGTETSLELGRWGRTGFERTFVRRTQMRLPPIGTWHSHPSSAPEASEKDRKTVAGFRKRDEAIGLPTIMAITGHAEDCFYVAGG